jgi:hypothetical protein
MPSEHIGSTLVELDNNSVRKNWGGTESEKQKL